VACSPWRAAVVARHCRAAARSALASSRDTKRTAGGIWRRGLPRQAASAATRRSTSSRANAVLLGQSWPAPPLPASPARAALIGLAAPAGLAAVGVFGGGAPQPEQRRQRHRPGAKRRGRPGSPRPRSSSPARPCRGPWPTRRAARRRRTRSCPPGGTGVSSTTTRARSPSLANRAAINCASRAPTSSRLHLAWRRTGARGGGGHSRAKPAPASMPQAVRRPGWAASPRKVPGSSVGLAGAASPGGIGGQSLDDLDESPPMLPLSDPKPSGPHWQHRSQNHQKTPRAAASTRRQRCDTPRQTHPKRMSKTAQICRSQPRPNQDHQKCENLSADGPPGNPAQRGEHVRHPSFVEDRHAVVEQVGAERTAATGSVCCWSGEQLHEVSRAGDGVFHVVGDDMGDPARRPVHRRPAQVFSTAVVPGSARGGQRVGPGGIGPTTAGLFRHVSSPEPWPAALVPAPLRRGGQAAIHGYCHPA
jgi:hypothetical protein